MFSLDAVEVYLQDVKILQGLGLGVLEVGEMVSSWGAEFYFVLAALFVLVLSFEVRWVGKVVGKLVGCSRDLSRGDCSYVGLDS